MLIVVAGISSIGLNTVSAVPGDNIYVNGTGGNDAWDGLSPHYNITTGHGPKLTIKSGVAAVNTDGQINIANGVYTGNDNRGITINKNMKIFGQSQTHTIINGSNAANIFTISNGVNLIIKNLTFTNGNSSNGGAIFCEGGLDAANCTFTYNHADDLGGAFDNEGSTTATFNECTFIGNTANRYGGAIESDNGCILNTNQCIFINNTAVQRGGAIRVWGTFIPRFNAFVGNSAPVGSAISIANGMLTFNAENNWWGSNSGPNDGSIEGGYYPTIWIILSVNANPNTLKYGETSTVTADFKHINGGGDLVGGNIPNGIPVYFTTAWGSITDSSLCTKDGIVTATYHANGPTLTTPVRIYANAENEQNTVYTTVNIEKAPTKLNVNHIIGYKGDIVDLIATLTNNHNLPVSGKSILFSVNNKFVGSAVTNALGIATLPYKIVQNSGTYTVLAEFIEDNNYLASSNTTTLTVPHTPTTIKTEALTGNKGETVNLKATLMDKIHNTPLAGKTIEFLINNKSVGSAVTNSNGIATLPYKIIQNGGLYNIEAVFNSDDVYSGSTGSANLKVHQSDLYVTIKTSDSNPKIGEKIFITFKVGNRGPDTANNVVLTFKVPEGMEFVDISVDTGSYTYNSVSRTITWNIGDVPVGDPKLVMELNLLKAGNFTLQPGLSTSTYDPNLASNIGTLNINVKSNSTNPAVVHGQTVPMQPTGAPVIPLLLGVLLTVAGIATRKK